LKVITADSVVGPGENEMRRTSKDTISINSSRSRSVVAMSGKERAIEGKTNEGNRLFEYFFVFRSRFLYFIFAFNFDLTLYSSTSIFNVQ
jgi:hypothetical protein